MAEQRDSLLGKIERYKIQERIGTGGMARVYRASDKSLDRDVAVKVLHEHLADDDLFRARFEREAKFIASFNHPNVIQIFDYATIDSDGSHLCYMVMTYLPGKTLNQIMDDYIAEGDVMPTDRVLQITKDIAAALDYAHGLGMVHRDIKPANILFNDLGGAVLTDFGIARLAESSKLTQENVTVGTPAYMAPEQAAGERVDSRTDIYAFGVILYELLAGQPPFGDDGSISVLIKHLNEPVPPLTNLDHIDSEFLDAVVTKTLSKNPDKRYQTATELAEDLERALNGEVPVAISNSEDITDEYRLPSQAVDNAQVVKQARLERRNNTPVGLLAIGLGIMLAVVLIAFVVNQRRPVTIVVAPTLDPPPVPTATATLDPADFRSFGGIDSMVEEETSGVDSMTSSDNMGFETDFTTDDDFIDRYWSQVTTESESRDGEITREVTDDGTYIVTNSIRNLVGTSIVDDLYYTEDYTVEATLTLTEASESNSGYGLVFHYVDPSNYGVFAVDGVGRYSIWFLENGRWRELRDMPENWTPNDAINETGVANTLRLEVAGSTLTGYVNETQVLEIEDGSIDEGGVGLYLANPDREAAVAQVVLDRYEVVMSDEDDSTTADNSN